MDKTEYVFTIEYHGPYSSGSMIFTDPNKLNYWAGEFYRLENVRCTIRRLCKRHAKYLDSARHGKCCKILDQF